MENNLLTLLKKSALVVRELENQANIALLNNNDTTLYSKIMQEKAIYLEHLYTLASPFLEEEKNNKIKQHVTGTLASFSSNAATALRLNSSFYMSALLYPDDYQEGELNNLELLVAFVENFIEE